LRRSSLMWFLWVSFGPPPCSFGRLCSRPFVSPVGPLRPVLSAFPASGLPPRAWCAPAPPPPLLWLLVGPAQGPGRAPRPSVLPPWALRLGCGLWFRAPACVLLCWWVCRFLPVLVCVVVWWALPVVLSWGCFLGSGVRACCCSVGSSAPLRRPWLGTA